MKMILSETKKCSKCGGVKNVSNFYPYKNSKDKLQSRCKECNKKQSKEYHLLTYIDNRDFTIERIKEYYNNNKEEISVKKRAWYKKYKDRERASQKEWKLLNKALLKTYAAKRRSTKLYATPPWLTDKQLEEIKNFYWLATDIERISGEKYHVDHIVPLQGKNVCGLHVPWNLQILPAEINVSKGNRYD